MCVLTIRKSQFPLDNARGVSDTPPTPEPETAPSQQLYEEIKDVAAALPQPLNSGNIPPPASPPQGGGVHHPYEDVRSSGNAESAQPYQFTVCSAYGVSEL